MRRLEELAERVTGEMTVRTAFGDPITAGERTVVPVARIGYGFGGGFGESDAPNASGDTGEEPVSGESGGFGAGGGVRPYGVIEITEEETRFVPVRNGRWRRRVMIAAVCGFAAGWLAGRRRSRNP